jgi:hypothetical protein
MFQILKHDLENFIFSNCLLGKKRFRFNRIGWVDADVGPIRLVERADETGDRTIFLTY